MLLQLCISLLFLSKSMVLWSTNINWYLQIVFFLLSCSGQVHLNIILLHLIHTLGSFDLSDLWEGWDFLNTFALAFSKPQVIGDVSPGVLLLNRKRCLIKVTVIGHPPCYAYLVSTCLWLWASTNCAITVPSELTLCEIKLNVTLGKFHELGD